MRVDVRPCTTPADYAAMKQVLVAGRRACPDSVYIHPGDLEWWRFYLLRDYAWPEIAHVWEADGGIIGWSLFTPHYAAFDLFALPAVRESPAMDAMLSWTEQRAIQLALERDHAAISTVWAFENDPIWAGHLARHGFAPQPGYAMQYLVHSLNALPQPTLPDGITLRHVEEADIDARAAAQRAAFGSERMTAAAYHGVRQAPGYRAELDVIAVAPDGRVASFVTGWLDAANGVGAFEPMGTAPDFRGRRLGKAVLAEGLRRMQAHGARRVIVYVEGGNTPAQALYRAVGFQPVTTIRAYGKAVG